jgi:hypothetical protein
MLRFICVENVEAEVKYGNGNPLNTGYLWICFELNTLVTI